MIIVPLKAAGPYYNEGSVAIYEETCHEDCAGTPNGTHRQGSEEDNHGCCTWADPVWDECWIFLEGICLELGKHKASGSCSDLLEEYTPAYLENSGPEDQEDPQEQKLTV